MLIVAQSAGRRLERALASDASHKRLETRGSGAHQIGGWLVGSRRVASSTFSSTTRSLAASHNNDDSSLTSPTSGDDGVSPHVDCRSSRNAKARTRARGVRRLLPLPSARSARSSQSNRGWTRFARLHLTTFAVVVSRLAHNKTLVDAHESAASHHHHQFCVFCSVLCTSSLHKSIVLDANW